MFHATPLQSTLRFTLRTKLQSTPRSTPRYSAAVYSTIYSALYAAVYSIFYSALYAAIKVLTLLESSGSRHNSVLFYFSSITRLFGACSMHHNYFPIQFFNLRQLSHLHRLSNSGKCFLPLILTSSPPSPTKKRVLPPPIPASPCTGRTLKKLRSSCSRSSSRM